MMFYALERGNETGHISAHILPSACPLDTYSNVVNFNILVLMPPLLSLCIPCIVLQWKSTKTRSKPSFVKKSEKSGVQSVVDF